MTFGGLLVSEIKPQLGKGFHPFGYGPVKGRMSPMGILLLVLLPRVVVVAMSTTPFMLQSCWETYIRYIGYGGVVGTGPIVATNLG